MSVAAPIAPEDFNICDMPGRKMNQLTTEENLEACPALKTAYRLFRRAPFPVFSGCFRNFCKASRDNCSSR